MSPNEAVADLKPQILEALAKSPLTKEELAGRLDPDLAPWLSRALLNLAHERKVACSISGLWYRPDGPGPDTRPPPERPQEAAGATREKPAPVIRRRMISPQQAVSELIERSDSVYGEGEAMEDPGPEEGQEPTFPMQITLNLKFPAKPEGLYGERLIEALRVLGKLAEDAPKKVVWGNRPRKVYDYAEVYQAVRDILTHRQNRPIAPRFLAREVEAKGIDLGKRPAETLSRILRTSKHFVKIRSGSSMGMGWRLRE